MITRYSYSELSQPIDADEHCRDGRYSEYWRWFGNLPEFIRGYEKVKYGTETGCNENVKRNLAIVHFYIAPSANDLINKIVKTPRVTYADILSNIGIIIISTLVPFNIKGKILNMPYFQD